MANKKILFVDDEKDMLDMVSIRLKSAGYDVVVAENGCEAFERAHAERPDLIILDVMLPKMDGYELCSLFKSDISLMDIPVILLTARSQKEDIEIGMAAGADSYITKPMDGDVLLRTISELLQANKVPPGE